MKCSIEAYITALSKTWLNADQVKPPKLSMTLVLLALHSPMNLDLLEVSGLDYCISKYSGLSLRTLKLTHHLNMLSTSSSPPQNI